MKKRVILISLDALGSSEFSLVKNLPHFGKIISGGVYCKREYSVYPSLTFPCHASIATGCRPGSHGIVSNYLFEPGREIPHWNFYASNLKRKAIWDYANQHQKTVLNMSWPVSAGGGIRWSMPEMTPVKPKVWNAANFIRQLEVFRRYGTLSFAAHTFLNERGLMKTWLTGKQPDLDIRITSAFEQALRRYPWDISMLHVYGLDNAKHNFRIESPQSRDYLKLYDNFVGKLMAYVDEREAAGETVTLMITGDHSQRPVQKMVYLNVVLHDLGFCRFENGKLVSWKALFAPCDGSAYLYVKDKKNLAKILKAVRGALAKNPAVKCIFSQAEAAALGADPDCSLMVEAAEGYGIDTNWCAGKAINLQKIAPTTLFGLHGYLPDYEDYQTMFFCYGPEVRQGYEVQEMSIMDITPTICHWMGFQADPTDGKAIPGIFLSDAP